ncbi:MAG: hypothetical protein ACYC1M_12980 [Armatimonadota bacterium]
MAVNDALAKLLEMCQRGSVLLFDDALDEFVDAFEVTQHQLCEAIDADDRLLIRANIAFEDDEPEYDADGPPPIWKAWKPGLKHTGITVCIR